MTLGQQIRYHRKKKGLTQTELAQRAGLEGKVIISYYENDKRNPSIKVLQTIAECLECSVNILLKPVKTAPTH